MSIAILCPTRGRPEQCKRMVASARNNNTKIYLGIWSGDIVYSDLVKHSYAKPNNLSFLNVPDLLPTAHKWNLLAEVALKNPDHKLFMLGSDDMYFETPAWDKALLDHYNALENKIHVYSLQDSRDKNGTPHPIVTREYVEAMGYFMPPIFLHWFIDSWTVSIAKANDVYEHLSEFRLIHDKPSDIGNGDETHNRIREWGWHQRDVWVNDTCQHFLELEKQRLKGKINA